MDSDDLEPKRPTLGAPLNMDEQSIEALGEYIDALKAEITRTEQAIEKKKAALGAADAFFKG